VAVRPEAQEHEVELRVSAALRGQYRADKAIVAGRGLRGWPQLPAEPMDAATRDRDTGEELFPGRPKVAVGVVGGNAPFVGEEDLDRPPRTTRSVADPQAMVERDRSVPPGEDEGEPAPISDRQSRPRPKVAREGRARGGEIRIDLNPAVYSRNQRCPHPSTSDRASAGPHVPAG